MPAALRAILLALALLGAQQVALAHAISHLDAKASQEEGQKRLCDLHSAMGSVLGALDTASPALWLEGPAAACFCAALVSAASLPSPSPAARGPPAVSLK